MKSLVTKTSNLEVTLPRVPAQPTPTQNPTSENGSSCPLPQNPTMSQDPNNLPGEKSVARRARFVASTKTSERDLANAEDPAVASDNKSPRPLPPDSSQTTFQCFSMRPGENFVVWRSHFLEAVRRSDWDLADAKNLAFAHMRGEALAVVIDVDRSNKSESLDDFLDKYQKRFLPTVSPMLLSWVTRSTNDAALHSRSTPGRPKVTTTLEPEGKQEETPANEEPAEDVFSVPDFPSWKDQAVAALLEEVLQEDPLRDLREKDFPKGQ